MIDGAFNTEYPKAEDLFLNDLPDGVTLLPDDWEGPTTRMAFRSTVSNDAIENEEFDLRGFLKDGFNNVLTAIRKDKGLDVLSLTHRMSVSTDRISDPQKTHFDFHIEYWKQG